MQQIFPKACRVLSLPYNCFGWWQRVIAPLCVLCKWPRGIQLKTLGAHQSCMGDCMKSHCCCPVVANNHLHLVGQIATCKSGHVWPNVAWLAQPAASLLLLSEVDMVGNVYDFMAVLFWCQIIDTAHSKHMIILLSCFQKTNCYSLWFKNNHLIASCVNRVYLYKPTWENNCYGLKNYLLQPLLIVFVYIGRLVLFW